LPFKKEDDMNKKWLVGRGLAFILGCGLATSLPAQAAVEMTIATFHPRTRTADVEGLFHFKEVLEKSSNGGIKVNVFFGGTLGGERELVEQLKLGTVHLCYEGWGTRGAYARKIIPWGVPYLFSDKAQIQRTVAGRIGQELKATYLKQGIVWSGLYFRGNRQLTANRAIKVPADLKGMKLRLPETPDWIVVWKAFGTLPAPIPSPEIFGALQTGVVEAQENPVSSNYNAKLWEVQKYMVMTNHIVDMHAYLLSQKFLDGLSEQNRQLVQKAVEDSLEWSTKFSFDMEAQLIKEMEGKGMTILRPDLKPFQEIALGTMDHFKKQWEPWVYEEAMKAIGK
jgi:tripartite ATP-independent transporter DctP family solute receptor